MAGSPAMFDGPGYFGSGFCWETHPLGTAHGRKVLYPLIWILSVPTIHTIHPRREHSVVHHWHSTASQGGCFSYPLAVKGRLHPLCKSICGVHSASNGHYPSQCFHRRKPPQPKKTLRASTVLRVVGLADHFCPYAPTFFEGVPHFVPPNKI